NEEGDVNYAILRAIENGAGLYFILSYQNTTELKEDKLLSEYYSIRYDIWLEDVAKHYNKLNTVLKDVQTKVIIDHEFLVGDRVLDLDELEADIENRLEGAVNDQNKVQNDLTTSEAVAVAEAWNMLYNANTIMQDMLNQVEEINKGLEKRYNVSTGAFYDPAASDKERPKTNLADFAELMDDPNLNPQKPIPGSGSGVINRYIYTQRVNDDTYYNSAINLVKTQFEKLRDSAVYFAQSTADLQAIIEKATAMEAEMQAAYDLINTTSIYDGKDEIRQALLKDAATWVSGVSSVAQQIEDKASTYLSKPGQDFLNKESECYFLPEIQDVIDFYFNEQFSEGGEYYEYYKEGGQYYTDYNGESVNAEQYPVDLVTIQRDLKSACPAVLFDEENIWAQVQGSGDETEDENSDSNAVNNNHIVVVTYGDRDADTFEKTPYKSIILNYNSYAVRVTYNNTIYTVPSGGYIVIDYD
ncbi:MAG: hypothetical protein J6V22_00040, partial [Clostridia bacterium]|nr:hypothetical protein [Clostridia bacterium]